MTEPIGETLPGFFSELMDLERDAAVLAGRLKAAEVAVFHAAGRDQTEQVRVVLAPPGRIASVEIEPRWRSRIHPAGLPAAALAAYREAGNRRLETWAAEVGSHPYESDSTPHATFEEGSTGPGPSDESSYESIRRLWSLLQDATDRLDEVIREAAARRLAVVTGRDPGGHVTAFLTGAGELTDLALDEGWAAEGGNREIGTALTTAIIDGYAAVDQRAREFASQWPFPDLDRLSGDSATLLATLGLPPVASDNNSRQE